MSNESDYSRGEVKVHNVNFETEPGNLLGAVYRRLTSLYGLLDKRDYAHLNTYVMFLGYPRSGHTLVGSLLDAHPSCRIGHELDALYYVKSGYSKFQLYYLIKKNRQLFEKQGQKWMGYDYNVQSIEGGLENVLTHIGDKCGGRSTRRLGLPGQEDLLEKLKTTVELPVKIIHVIRNPFDNISTMALRIRENTDRLLHNTLSNAIKRYKNNLKINQQVRNSGEYEMIDIHLKDLVANPGQEMSRLCDFLELPLTREYQEACIEKVWNRVSESRYKIKEYWKDEEKESVDQLISTYDFLSPYHNTPI